MAETAVIAQAFGWSLDAILDLEHRDRRAFAAHARASGSHDTGAR
ncbi:hypothetical protein [Conexibacter sp. W3-3-2]|nr:hypothetical protein [Conexibacter sp. W3-3-2]